MAKLCGSVLSHGMLSSVRREVRKGVRASGVAQLDGARVAGKVLVFCV